MSKVILGVNPCVCVCVRVYVCVCGGRWMLCVCVWVGGCYVCGCGWVWFRTELSLIPRFSCGGGGKRAWYTLFAHAPSYLDNLHTTLLH